MAFCQLLGIAYDPGMELTDSLQPAVEPQQYYVDNEQVVKNRAEFELLQYGIRATKLQTAIKRGEYLPEVGIGASVFYLNAMNNGGIYNTAVFCSVSIPISGWWGASHILKGKKSRKKSLKTR
jgi:outer membrane protein